MRWDANVGHIRDHGDGPRAPEVARLVHRQREADPSRPAALTGYRAFGRWHRILQGTQVFAQARPSIATLDSLPRRILGIPHCNDRYQEGLRMRRHCILFHGDDGQLSPWPRNRTERHLCNLGLLRESQETHWHGGRLSPSLLPFFRLRCVVTKSLTDTANNCTKRMKVGWHKSWIK